MSTNTAIEWTEATWNPTTGCTKVSPGCAHCYIERTPPFRIEQRRFESGHISLQFHPERLTAPLHWRKPRRVFVNSLSDLFHESVPDLFIERVFSVMALAERHTFQVLTKRPERMALWFKARRFDVKGYAILQSERRGECLYAHPWPLPNVWLGTSVENKRFLSRIDILKDIPAAVRFVSFEPLLEDLGALVLDGIQWAIVGGESGPHARPMDLAWARSIVRECHRQGVACFVKQVGAHPFERRKTQPDPDFDVGGWTHIVCAEGEWWQRGGVRDRKGGDPAEWPADLRVREFPEVHA